MNKWDERWLCMAELVASWSKDMSRKVGAVIVDDRKVVLSIGYNGFPRGVDDTIEHRHKKGLKYQYTAHAEANAIANAAANGTRLLGSTIYITLPPCADCARLIIQSGISKVVIRAITLEQVPSKYVNDLVHVQYMFQESNVIFTGE